MTDSKDQLYQVKTEIEDLKSKLDEFKSDGTNYLQNKGSSVPAATLNLVQRRVLKGHFGKIYSVNWSQDNVHLVSASQDGKLLIWNGQSTNKAQAIPLRSCWVMTCAYAPSGGLVACGGLDNLCSVYRVNLKADVGDGDPPMVELAQHEGYLSSCKFVDDDKILTSSGDSTCLLWDIKAGSSIASFSSHSGDVMSISVDKTKNLFVSGSVDSTAKLWDLRDSKKCIKTFYGHDSDINSVDFFPSGTAFATGSDDSSCRLFDLKCYRQVNNYMSEQILCGITSVKFSGSGRFLFAGYDDWRVQVWDSIAAKQAQTILQHDDRVSCLDVSSDGQALVTGSWDTFLKVFA